MGTLPVLPTAGDYLGDIRGATRDGFATCEQEITGTDAWYRFIPNVTARYGFNLCSTNPSWDSVLSIHSACPAGQLSNTLACDDDFCTDFGLSSVTSAANLVAGQTYYIRVAGFDALEQGAFRMFIANLSQNGVCCSGDTCFVSNVLDCGIPDFIPGGTCSPFPCSPAAPVNDACEGATPARVRTAIYGDNRGADTTVIITPTLCGTDDGSSGAKDVFYSFTPEISASYSMSLCSSFIPDTVLGVFAGCPAEDLNFLACNDDSGATEFTCAFSPLNSRISSVFLDAGQTYIVRVAAYDEGSTTEGGWYSFYVDYADIPFAGACCVAGACSIVQSGTCAGAYKGDGEVCNPTPCGGGGDGVCCVGATCVISSSANCTGQYAAFAQGASCNVTGNATTPCCHANYNKADGINVQDIFDYLSDWFEQRPRANIVSNGVGAPTVDSIFAFLNAWFAGGC